MFSRVDAIVVLGGGSQRGPRCTDLPMWVRRRLELAAHVFHRQCALQQQQGQQHQQPPTSVHFAPPKIILLSAGTPHRPNYIDEASGFPILESTAAADYLRTVHRIDPAHLWREQCSLDTIGNAYFLRTSFLDPAAPGRFRRVCVITSEFHMPRTRAVFDWVLIAKPTTTTDDDADCAGLGGAGGRTFVAADSTAASDDVAVSSTFPFAARVFGTSINAAEVVETERSAHVDNSGVRKYDGIEYLAVSDDGTMPTAALEERCAREAQSLVGFTGGICVKLRPLLDRGAYAAFVAGVQQFVLTDHKAYCVHGAMLEFPARGVWTANTTY